MDKMDKNGMDFREINIERIKALFPECVTDGKIDFDKLKVLLGEEVDSSNEKYSFNWIGKSASIKNAITPSTATLIPCKEKSQNWDTTENLYIEGDNLEVLKTLSKTYHGQIKMIYIDPPYNTGKDFVYNDNFHDNSKDYIENTEQAYRANPETSGKYHTNWLNMIYPRLKIAKDLLADEGVMFISIDDNEVTNLSKVCDEIFGEYNCLAKMIWKSKSGGANDVNNIACDSEFILAYAKNIDATTLYLDMEAEVTTTYNHVDEDGRRYSLDRLDKQSLGYHASLDFQIIGPDGKIYEVEHKNPNNKVARWRWGKDTVQERYDELVFKYPYVYTKNYEKEGATPRNLLIEDRFGRTRTGKTEMAALFNNVVYFDFPKPTKLIKYLASISTDKADTILDFFSGSATTAHAIAQLNAEDGGKRKVILVQLPEETDKKSKAYMDGYFTICDIGQERMRRAGEKIYNEVKEKYDNAGLFKDSTANPDDFDFGFKVFKLDSTCIKPWDPTVKYDESNIFELMDVIKEGRSNLDVAYEIMLKYGVFNMPLEEKLVNGKTIYSVGGGYMIISLNDEITSDDVKAIAELKPKAVVFKESGFKDDSAKMNADYTFKRLGIDNVKCI